jgi:hypothetical protein
MELSKNRFSPMRRIHRLDDMSLLLVQAGVARDDAETWLSQLQSGEL